MRLGFSFSVGACRRSVASKKLRWTAMQKEQSQLARGCREQGYFSKAEMDLGMTPAELS